MKRIKFNYNQLELPFREASKSVHFEDRIKLFWLLVAVVISSLALYVYAINATARNIAMREHLEREVAQVSSNLSLLEFEYIALKNGITAETASELGFEEAREPLYVSRDAEDSLTFNSP